MIRRSSYRRQARRGGRGGYPISHLGGELSAVINRVRQAFGPLPMRDAATRAEVKLAEQVVDQTARRLLRGDADLSAWHRALRQYEAIWMAQLDRLRREPGGRCAA